MSLNITHMDKNTVSLREIQRHYRKLINDVKRTRTPLYLGARFKPEVVLIGVDTFEQLQKRANHGKKSWDEVKRILELSRKSGRQGVNLAKFIHNDRKRH